MVSGASDEPVAATVAGLVPAVCEAEPVEAVVVLGAVELARRVGVTGSIGASGDVGLAVPTGIAGSTGDVGASAVFGTRFEAGVVDTDISTIGASSVPPSTGARRHQFGMFHHMRRSAAG
jgi:hypothetical protein